MTNLQIQFAMSSKQETTHVDDEDNSDIEIIYSTATHADDEDNSDIEIYSTATHVDNEAEHLITTDVVPVQSSFVQPDNDIEIDFQREIEYYSTVAHATHEAEHSESELRWNDSNAYASVETLNTTQHPQFSGEVYYQPEFTDEQCKNYEKSESSDEEGIGLNF